MVSDVLSSGRNSGLQRGKIHSHGKSDEPLRIDRNLEGREDNATSKAGKKQFSGDTPKTAGKCTARLNCNIV